MIIYNKKKSWLLGGWVDGWMDGWMEAKAGLRIAYSNQKFFSYIKIGIENGEKMLRKIEINWVENTLNGKWVKGLKEGSQSRVKDCLQQLKIRLNTQFSLYMKTRPVWTGFKIAVRPKLLTHYYKVRCLDTIIICNS